MALCVCINSTTKASLYSTWLAGGHWEAALTARKLDTSVFLMSPYVWFIAVAMLGSSSTGLEYGVLSANVQTGGSLTTRLYNPTLIVDLGETHPGNSAWAWGTCHNQQEPKDLTGHQGFDSVTEVDGTPETFVLCEVWKFRSLVCAVRRTKVDLRPKLLGAKSQMGRSDTSGISMSSHPFVATMDPYGVWCWAFLRPIYIAIFIGRDLLIYSVESAHFDFCLGSQKETSQHRTLQVAIWFLMNDNWLLHTEYAIENWVKSCSQDSCDQWNIRAEGLCPLFNWGYLYTCGMACQNTAGIGTC